MSFTITQTEDLLADLIHDLRQPLSTIGHSVCYLELLLAQAEEPVREQLRLLARQVDVTAGILLNASAHMRPPAAQCAGESLDLTKSQRAAVT
jgi:signal transduction histidine kinase